MAFPISFPTEKVRSVSIRARSVVGVSSSPYTFASQVFPHAGQIWEADVEYVPMGRADAEELIGLLLSLNGREGTLLLGDPAGREPRGAGGSPVVEGAGQTGYALTLSGFAADTAVIATGDWLQVGAGASTRLHKATGPATSNGSGIATVPIWPRLRYSPVDDSAVVLNGARGIWRLTTNVSGWSISNARRYGISFSVLEA